MTQTTQVTQASEVRIRRRAIRSGPPRRGRMITTPGRQSWTHRAAVERQPTSRPSRGVGRPRRSDTGPHKFPLVFFRRSPDSRGESY